MLVGAGGEPLRRPHVGKACLLLLVVSSSLQVGLTWPGAALAWLPASVVAGPSRWCCALACSLGQAAAEEEASCWSACKAEAWLLQREAWLKAPLPVGCVPGRCKDDGQRAVLLCRAGDLAVVAGSNSMMTVYQCPSAAMQNRGPDLVC